MKSYLALRQAVKHSGLSFREISRRAGLKDDSLQNNLAQAKRRDGDLTCEMVARYLPAMHARLCIIMDDGTQFMIDE